MTNRKKFLVLGLPAFALILFLQFYGIDKLVLNSDELHPARTLISDDWSLVHYPWPKEAVREYFADWPIQFPPLFGLLTRWSVDVFHVNHFALRFFPALFAVAAVVGSFFLFRLFMTIPWAVAGAIIMGTASDKLMLYAKSLKHYTADVLVTVLLLYCGQQLLRKKSYQHWIWFTCVAALGLWLAFASVFVSCGIYITLISIMILQRRQEPGTFRALAVSAVVFAFSFLVLYKVNISKAVTNQVFLTSWSLQVLDWSKISDVGYLVRFFLHKGLHIALLPRYYFVDNIGLAVVVNFLIAIWLVVQIRSRQWRLLAFLLLPLALLLTASVAGRYPFSAGRLSLFLLPSWILMAISGFKYLFDFLMQKDKRFALAFVVMGALIWTYPAAVNVVKVFNLKYAGGRRVDQLMLTLKANAIDGDTVFLHWGTILPFYFYFTDHQPGYQSTYPIQKDDGTVHVIYGEEHTFHPEKNEMLFKRVSEVPGRLWVAFGHLYPLPEMLELENLLGSKRQLVKIWDFKGCRLLLYGADDSTGRMN
jgi:hypothetical protein